MHQLTEQEIEQVLEDRNNLIAKVHSLEFRLQKEKNLNTKMENAYLLFAGQEYQSRGGMFDCVGRFNSQEEAEQAIPKNCDWYHIINLETWVLDPSAHE